MLWPVVLALAPASPPASPCGATPVLLQVTPTSAGALAMCLAPPPCAGLIGDLSILMPCDYSLATSASEAVNDAFVTLPGRFLHLRDANKSLDLTCPSEALVVEGDCHFVALDAEDYVVLGDNVHDLVLASPPAAPPAVPPDPVLTLVVQIYVGWNLISFNVIQPDMTVPTFLAPLATTHMDLLKGQTDYTRYISNFGWMGTLTAIDVTSAY